MGKITTKSITPEQSFLMETVNALVEECHTASRTGGWYNDPNTGAEIDRNIPEMLAMVHSEVSEALEGHRKGSPGAPGM